MSAKTSPPLLLIFNVDTCHQCTKLLAQRDLVNKAIKERYPDLRTIWISLDQMDSSRSITPEVMKDQLKYFPTLIYYARGNWDQYVENPDIFNGKIMSIEDIQKNGMTWGPDKIMNWLDTIVDPSERCDEWAQTIPKSSKTDLIQEVATEIGSWLDKVVNPSTKCIRSSQTVPKSSGVDAIQDLAQEIMAKDGHVLPEGGVKISEEMLNEQLEKQLGKKSSLPKLTGSERLEDVLNKMMNQEWRKRDRVNTHALTYTSIINGTKFTFSYDFEDEISVKMEDSRTGSVAATVKLSAIVRLFL
jgi:hypothetical protein